jgi:hypothetical protein
MSGSISARPTPEAVFGSAGNGVFYYATDQGMWYQWNGTSWNLMRCIQELVDLSEPLIIDPFPTYTALNSVTIPAGFLIPGFSLEIDAWCSVSGSIGGAVPKFKIQVGGQDVGEAIAAAASTGYFHILTRILVASSGLRYSALTSPPNTTVVGQISSNFAVSPASPILVQTLATTAGSTSGATFQGRGLTISMRF